MNEISIWKELDVETKVRTVLSQVAQQDRNPAFGVPYLTAYQLASEIDRQFPEIRLRLSYPIGGAGVGVNNSLAQYLAKQLSDHIRDEIGFAIEGAFLSNAGELEVRYRAHDGSDMTSSLTGSGDDLSMFRLRG